MATNPPDQAPVAELDFEPGALELAFAKHKSKFILVAALAGLAALGYYGQKLWKEHADQVSGQAFAKAESLEDFRKVAKDYAGKNAGGSAVLMAAQLLAQDGKSAEAITELNDFLKAYPEHPLADLATLRLADAHLQSGATAQAKEMLATVAEKFSKSPHAPLALLRLGDLYAADKDVEKAKEYIDAQLKYVALREAKKDTRKDQVGMFITFFVCCFCRLPPVTISHCPHVKGLSAESS